MTPYEGVGRWPRGSGDGKQFRKPCIKCGKMVFRNKLCVPCKAKAGVFKKRDAKTK